MDERIEPGEPGGAVPVTEPAAAPDVVPATGQAHPGPEGTWAGDGTAMLDRPAESGVTRAAVLDLPNEAIPAVPPVEGTSAVGTIPAAEARRAWARVQALNWRLYLIRFLCAGLAVVLTVVVLPGLGFSGWRWGEFLRIAVIFGLLNATVKPLLQFLVLRFIFSTYGIVVVLINALLLMFLGSILDDTFAVYRPAALLGGGAVVGLLGMVFETLLGATPPVLDRDYRERNGLA